VYLGWLLLLKLLLLLNSSEFAVAIAAGWRMLVAVASYSASVGLA
jgi:hypothetical protein